MAMDHETSVTWAEQLPEETLMATGNEDDFSNFLEFGIDFADLEGHSSAAVQHQRGMQHPDNHIVTSMAENARLNSDHNAPLPQYPSVVGNHLAMGIPNNGQINDPAFHFSHGQPQQQQQQNQHQHQHQHQHQQSQQSPQQMNLHSHHQLVRQNPQSHPEKYPPQHPGSHPYSEGQHVIPPTPNSVELHGAAARYPQRVETGNELYDRYGQMNDDQAAFYTPLVSPAMTPLETQFRLPEYTVPGEYFTPLTSPALEPQNSNPNGYPFQTSQPPSTHSPMDTSATVTMTSAPSSPAVFRRQRRRPSTATRATGRAAKASPSIQPKNWRKQNTQILPDEIANLLIQEQGSARPATSGGSSLRYSGHDSSQDSVSPEPISEPLMPPPAVPQTRKSPAFRPQMSRSDTSAPATPATLMKIHNQSQHAPEPSGQFSGFASLVPSEPQDELMEDVELPEAATDTRPRPSRLDTSLSTKEQRSAQSTPSAEPRSSERAHTGSVTPGPHSGAMPSPSGPVPKKSESKPTTSRKRQSVSSSHVSPALRPRISPSIQPLVRGEVGMSSETSAMYLASKSNYQHILDGTVLPGVSYPENLAENLSSKRTNHKLAEQGRRNRINTALKEIEGLIPPDFARARAVKESKEGAAAAKNGEKDKDKNAPQTISKASTVEMAIDYIKHLQQQVADSQVQLKEAESKLSTQKCNCPGDGDEKNGVTNAAEDTVPVSAA